MKNVFKYPTVDLYPEKKKNWFQRLWIKRYNRQIDKLFTCRMCGKGELKNLHGYFECEECGHEYK